MALRQPVLRAPRLEFDRTFSFPAGPSGHLGDQRPHRSASTSRETPSMSIFTRTASPDSSRMVVKGTLD
jgi:hypothetical protein